MIPALPDADIRPFGAGVQAVHLTAGELRAVVLTRGAILQDLRLAGTPWSLTLGSASLGAYDGPMGYFGAVVGPVANRIAGAAAELDGRRLRFVANEGTTLLHGGTSGTQAQDWRIAEAGPDRAVLALDLPDGLGGFPGNRRLRAEWRVAAPAVLELALSATTDAPTLMNLANHSYWNLDGRDSVLGHRLRVAADAMLPVDAAMIPTGAVQPVAGPFDLRAGRVLDGSEGFDHNFCCAGGATPAFAAELAGRSGVRLVLETTAPGLQVYDGRKLATAPWPGHAGQPYGPHGGIALEPQLWPDAPHHAGFPSIRLDPGAVWRQLTRWHFTRDSR